MAHKLALVYSFNRGACVPGCFQDEENKCLGFISEPKIFLLSSKI